MKMMNYYPLNFYIFMITCGRFMTCGISMMLNNYDLCIGNVFYPIYFLCVEIINTEDIQLLNS